MKQKDMAIIIAAVAASGMISFFVSRAVFVTPKDRQQKVEVVAPIDPAFNTAGVAPYINPASIDPTQMIQIGTNNNTAPFNGGGPH